MFLREPLFNGQNDIEQIFKIFKVLGHPEENDWPGIGNLPHYNPQ